MHFRAFALLAALAALPAFAQHGGGNGRGRGNDAPEPLVIGGLVVAGGALLYARHRSRRQP
jgi:hypothetical protein